MIPEQMFASWGNSNICRRTRGSMRWRYLC